LVVGFNDLKLESEIAAELKRLRSVEVVRLVDVVVVAKSKNGELVPVKAGELSQGESAKFGAIVGALVGLDDDDQPGAPSEDTGEVLGFLGDAIAGQSPTPSRRGIWRWWPYSSIAG
jgi:hypothetical protein